MILNKYLVALLQVAVLFLAALQAALVNGLTETEAWQVAGLLVGAIVTYYVPILKGPWAAGLKVGGAALGAVIAAIVPLLGGWDNLFANLTIILIALVNALATQFGVDVRIDSAKRVLANPDVRSSVAWAVDQPAAIVADSVG